MDDGGIPRTSVTLLDDLKRAPTDQAAWSRFVDRYGPCMISWCHRWGLQEADALDVSQQVLLKLSEKLRDFDYDPSRTFRGWLKTIVHHAWRDWLEHRNRRLQGSGDTAIQELMLEIDAIDDLAGQLEREHRGELLNVALRRIQGRVEPKTWEAFRLLALEGLAASEVSSRLQISVAAAYMAKSRVMAMLREECEDADLDERRH